MSMVQGLVQVGFSGKTNAAVGKRQDALHGLGYCAGEVSAGSNGEAGRGWAGMLWAPRAAQRMAKTRPQTPRPQHLQEAAKYRKILGVPRARRKCLWMRNTWCPRCWRLFTIESFERSQAHTAYQTNPNLC